MLWHYEEPGAFGQELHLPLGEIQLIIMLGAPRPKAVVQGMYEQPFVLDRAEQRAVMGVVFPAASARAFWALPLSQLSEQHVGAEHLWRSSQMDELPSRLQAQPCAQARLGLLERVLAAHLLGPGPAPAVTRALEQIRAGQAEPRAIADGLGLSTRQLRRAFLNEVGLTPKKVVRVFRFQRALSMLPSATSLSEVALACGYADQAHFSNEFRRLSGRSPGVYREQSPQFSNHVSL